MGIIQNGKHMVTKQSRTFKFHYSVKINLCKSLGMFYTEGVKNVLEAE